jgi:DNA-binding CsgD family transcriptional regulator
MPANAEVKAVSFVAQAREESFDDPLLALELDVQEASALATIDPKAERARRLVADSARVAQKLGLAEAPDERSRRALIAVLRAQSLLAMHDARTQEKRDLDERVVAVARGLDEREYLESEYKAAVASTSLGHLARADERLARVVEEAQRGAFPRQAVFASIRLALTRFDRGRIDAAEAAIGVVSDLVDRVAGSEGRIAVAWASNLVKFARGDWRGAIDGFAATRDEVCSTAHDRLILDHYICEWLGRVRGEETSRELMRWIAIGDADAEAAHCDRCGWDFQLAVAEGLARIGRLDDAHARLIPWDAHEHSPLPYSRVRRWRVAGLLSAAESGDEWLQCFERSVAEAEQVGLVHGSLVTRLDLAHTLAAHEPARALETFERVVDHARGLGAGFYVAAAHQGMRALGARPWKRRRTDGALSERESQVGAHVAAGETNREIAAALFLSTKTVERHVSNLLRKLEVRNRTELAARLRELDAQVEGISR